MEITGIDEWVNSVTERYGKLNESQRNHFLDRLLDSDGSVPQLMHLNKKLPELFRVCDFIHALPPELSEMILNYLDAESLLACCQVSRRWSEFVSQLDGVWKKECERLGIEAEMIEMTRRTKKEEGLVAKRLYLRRAKLMTKMKNCSAFCRNDLLFHRAAVTAVSYFNGRIYAGCNEGIISVWNAYSCQLLKRITAGFTVTCIGADSEVLLASSTVGTLSSWKDSGDRKSELSMTRLNYTRHVGSIFSFDFDSKSDLLVSGSSDKAVKLWSLSSTRLITSLRGHDKWVLKVVLGCSDVKRNILTMQCDVLFVWSYDSNDSSCTLVSRVPIVNRPSTFFTPGLHSHHDCTNYVFVQQDRTGTSSDRTELCRYDVRANVLSESWKSDLKVKILLAVGKRYVCFALQQKEDPNVVVLDLVTSNVVARLNIPPTTQVTPDPQICFCDDQWLSGFDFADACKVGMPVIAVGLQNGAICLIKWKKMSSLALD